MTIERDVFGNSYFDYLQDLRRGNITNRSSFDKFGFNSDLDSGVKETIWEEGGLFTTPNSLGYFLRITSTNSQDTFDTGTGALSLKINGVGSGWVEQTKVYCMDGLNSVVSSDDNWLGVNRCTLSLAGSSISATGTIKGFVHTATDSVQLFQINSGESITHQCIYWVPFEKTAYIDKVGFETAKIVGGGNPIVTFNLNVFTNSENASYNYFTAVLDTAVTDFKNVDRRHTKVIPEKSVIQVTGSTDTNNTYAYAFMNLTIIDD